MEQKVIRVNKSAQKWFSPNEVILSFVIDFVGDSEQEVRSRIEASSKELRDKADEYFKGMDHTADSTDCYISECGVKKEGYKYACSSTFTLNIVFGNYENLKKVDQYVNNCLDANFIHECTYVCALSNKEELEAALDVSLIKQCEDKANMILSTIGNRSAGVAEITCRSDLRPTITEENNRRRNVGNFYHELHERKIVISESVSCAFYINED